MGTTLPSNCTISAADIGEEVIVFMAPVGTAPQTVRIVVNNPTDREAVISIASGQSAIQASDWILRDESLPPGGGGEWNAEVVRANGFIAVRCDEAGVTINVNGL